MLRVHTKNMPHTHYLPILQIHLCTHSCLHDRKVYRCLQTMRVLYIYALHTYKYTIHAQNTEFTRTHTRWARRAHRCTPFTFTHTQTHVHTHTSHTQPRAFTHAPTHTASHTKVFLFLLPSCPPTLFLSCSLGNSKTLPVKRIPQLPTLERTFRVVSTYCFLCLFSSLLLLFGLEELNEKWPIN